MDKKFEIEIISDFDRKSCIDIKIYIEKNVTFVESLTFTGSLSDKDDIYPLLYQSSW